MIISISLIPLDHFSVALEILSQTQRLFLDMLCRVNINLLVLGCSIKLFVGLHIAISLQEILRWKNKNIFMSILDTNWPGLTHRSQNRKGCCLSSCRSHCRCRTEDSRAWNNTPPGWQPWPDWWGWWWGWWPWPPWCPPASHCRCVWQDNRTGHSRWCFPEDHQRQDTRNIPEIQFIIILPSWCWHQGAILYNKLIPLIPMKIIIKRKSIQRVSWSVWDKTSNTT